MESTVKVRGPLQARLQAELQAAWKRGGLTQESLAKAIGKKQTTVGQYLLNKRAGNLDLDEADAALRHIGSTLADFLASVPPRELTPTEILVRQLATRPELEELVRDLIPAQRPRLRAAIVAARWVLRAASGTPAETSSGSHAGPTRDSRTKRAPKTRR